MIWCWHPLTVSQWRFPSLKKRRVRLCWEPEWWLLHEWPSWSILSTCRFGSCARTRLPLFFENTDRYYYSTVHVCMIQNIVNSMTVTWLLAGSCLFIVLLNLGGKVVANMANICYLVLYDCMVNVREGEERDVSKDASFIFPQEEQAGRQQV